MSNMDYFMKANLGGYQEKDFRESDSIEIATSIIEYGRHCKAHLQKQDKTANIDGRISILLGSFEFQMVEAQVKTIPEDIDTTKDFSYSCETKIINIARFRVSSNPVVLFIIDRKRKRLFFKLFTPDYVDYLNIGDQKYKTLHFDNSDEYSDEVFIGQVLRLVKHTNTDTDCYVRCKKIRQIIRNAKKTYYRYNNDKLVDGKTKLYDEYEVYQRGDVIGTLAAFRIKQEGKRKYIRNGIIDMYHHNGKDGKNTDEHDIAVIHFEKGYVRITRQPSNSINITDADFGNIVIEIAKEVAKENLPVLYFHESPVYWFDGSQMYQMKSEFISLPWEMRL